jgi:hypothetical protein
MAIDGGEPVRSRPMPRRIQVGEAEMAAVERVMRRAALEGSGFDRYGLGVQARGTGAQDESLGSAETEVVRFERELAAFHGVRFVDAVSSGTAAAPDALTAEGIRATPLVPGMVPVADELAFVRELADRLPGVSHPVVDQLARELFVIWIHEGWSDDEMADAVTAFRKLDLALAR